MITSKTTKRLALSLAAFAFISFTAPSFVDARPSSSKSSGSRGSRSNDSVPATNTAPRTQQQGSPAQSAARAPEAAKPSFMNRFGGMIAGGLLGAGLFSLLSGGGFGGMAGMLGTLMQLLLIGGLAYLAYRFFRKKQEPAMAHNAPHSMNYQAPEPVHSSYVAPQAPAPRAPSDDVQITADDYNSFETLLTKVQDAYGREAMSELKPLVTPAMYNEFSDTVADNTKKGVHNQCGGATLLQGDLAESWHEDAYDYATVTMKYSLFDVTKNRQTGAVIEGSMSTPMEVIEHWTFVRTKGTGQTWILSGIDQI